VLHGVALIGPPQSSHPTKDRAVVVCPLCSYFFTEFRHFPKYVSVAPVMVVAVLGVVADVAFE
jgi:hypothetical protein